MKNFRFTPAVGILAVLVGSIAPVHATQAIPLPMQTASHSTGLHDFDFLVGEWRVHHRRLKERLARNDDWVEFDGTCSMRLLMAGSANVEDHVLNVPGGTYRAVGLRSYDSKTGQWAIWWLDGRNPLGPLEVPVTGRFENGVGAFYAEDTLREKPIRVRYIWSHITSTTARWEQSFSPDAGKTWETNWTMEYQRKG